MGFEYKIDGNITKSVAVENKENAPVIYIPAGQTNFGNLSVQTIGFIGLPNVTTEKLDGGESSVIVQNNNTSLSTAEAIIGEEGYIVASSDIIVAGLNETKKLYIKYIVVDFIFEELQLTTNGTQAILDSLNMTLSTAYKLQVFNGGYVGNINQNEIDKLFTSQNTVTTNAVQEVTSITITDNAFLKYWYLVEDNSIIPLANADLSARNYSLKYTLNSGNTTGYHSLIANTTQNSLTVQCSFYYRYINGIFTIVENTDTSARSIKKRFTTNPQLFTDLDKPAPIYTEEEFMNMSSGHHYILMNNLVLGADVAYAPITTDIASFDGNSYSITIKQFAYQDNSEEMQDSINLGLFENVSSNTTIKNVKVIINSKNDIDLSRYYRSVNYGTITAVNNGVITNCSVSFEKINETQLTEEISIADAFEINITTDESLSDQFVNNIGGLVGVNNGFITNSRVEQPINIVVHKETVSVVNETTIKETTPYYITSSRTACISKISGNGNVSGLVATNNGKISSSYVKGIQIINNGSQSSFNNTTAGLVGENAQNAQIAYSYVEGTFEQTTSTATEQTANTVRATGAGIIANGNIGAFVYLNKGTISNSYANIKVTTNARASGFVYDASDLNSSISDCFSISTLEQNNNAHTPFTGTSATQVLTNGNISECYYLLLDGDDFGNTENEPAVAMDLASLESEGSYSSFAFMNTEQNTDESKYIWIK